MALTHLLETSVLTRLANPVIVQAILDLEGAKLTILHYDTDFDLIAAVTGQPCQWIVPAGSVD
jgi:hypothetical protein